MMYYSNLVQERFCNELWIREDGEVYPIFDYKIENDQIRLISDPKSTCIKAITLEELVAYVVDEGTPLVPYTIVDELTGRYLDIKDRFSKKLILELCS